MSRRVVLRGEVKAATAGAGANASPKGRLESRGTRPWRPEPVWVTNRRDDLRVGVKCQANPEIAGSPRKVFRYRLGRGVTAEVAHWIGAGAYRLPTRTKRRMPPGRGR